MANPSYWGAFSALTNYIFTSTTAYTAVTISYGMGENEQDYSVTGEDAYPRLFLELPIQTHYFPTRIKWDLAFTVTDKTLQDRSDEQDKLSTCWDIGNDFLEKFKKDNVYSINEDYQPANEEYSNMSLTQFGNDFTCGWRYEFTFSQPIPMNRCNILNLFGEGEILCENYNYSCIDLFSQASGDGYYASDTTSEVIQVISGISQSPVFASIVDMGMFDIGYGYLRSIFYYSSTLSGWTPIFTLTSVDPDTDTINATVDNTILPDLTCCLQSFEGTNWTDGIYYSPTAWNSGINITPGIYRPKIKFNSGRCSIVGKQFDLTNEI